MKQVDILDYLIVIVKHRKLVIRCTALPVVVAAVLLFFVFPRWYRSTAVVMPPKQKDILGIMSSINKATSPLRAVGLGGPSTGDLAQFQTILRSRRVMEPVVHKFGLMNVYDVQNMEKALRELSNNVFIDLGKEDVSVEIAVEDTDPTRAADITNYFVKMLDSVYLELSVSEAGSNREFLELRYDQNLRDLQAAQESLKTFQQRYGIYSVDEQVKASIEVAAGIQSQIVLKQVKLGILSRTVSADNEEVRATKIELDALQDQMKELTFGSPGRSPHATVFAPFDQAPSLAMRYLNYLRDVEVQGKILELIVPLYEQAKIEEQRNTPSVLVLDSAVPSIRPTKPKRMIIMAVVFLLSFVVGVLWAFLLEFFRSAKMPTSSDDHQKLAQIIDQLRFRNLWK